MTDDEFHALVEQAHQLDELAQHPGWAVLTDYVLHGPAGSIGRQARVVNGHLKDFEAYLSETGWLAGAHHVLDARKTVASMVANQRLERLEQQAAEDDPREDE